MTTPSTPLRASVTAATGTALGGPVSILVDGSDTPITANGLSDYTPTPGDRLLVTRVGGQVEVLQYLSRGSVPYVSAETIDQVQADVLTAQQTADAASQATDNNALTISDHDAAIASLTDNLTTTQTNLDNYQSDTSAALTTLQSGYDVLTSLGTAGVQEDYIWVGNDPTQSTVKSVQISTYVQAGISAGSSSAFATAFSLWDRTALGDVTYQSSITPPMTTFYTRFTQVGLLAYPYM